jgi:hypothetical protein
LESKDEYEDDRAQLLVRGSGNAPIEMEKMSKNEDSMKGMVKIVTYNILATGNNRLKQVL